MEPNYNDLGNPQSATGSIYAKMFLGVVLILAVCFIAFGILLFNLLSNFIETDKEKQLYSNAVKVSDMTSVLWENYSPTVEYSYMTYLNIFNESLSSNILVVDKGGNIRYSAATSGVAPDRTTVDAEHTKEIFEGQVYTGKGNLGGVYARNAFVVGVPVYTSKGDITGGVFVSSNIPLNTLIDDIRGYYLFLSMCMLVACYAATYLMARRMIRPLQRMNAAVKQFANGNFDVRVPVTSNDEFGELAVAFNNMASSLNSVDKMRNDFVANVSHDLRTPMTVIAGFIDGILDNTIEKEKHREYLIIVRDEVLRLSRLVKNLLDIAKIEAGELTLNIVEFNICEMISKILISFESTISKKGIDVEVEFFSPQLYVLADYDSIFQVIYNLIDNAVKFTNQGGSLKLTAYGRDGKARITIRNSGQGISREEMPRLFEKFYKSDQSRSLDKKGTGLGLYICRTIINRHGENMTAKSVEGEYAEFSFDLPCAKTC